MDKKNMTAFEKALTDAALSRYQKILEIDRTTIQFSSKYRDAIAKLTKKTNRKTWKYVNTAWKRVLAAVIAMFLLAATACAAVPALREGLIRLFTHDDGIAYTFEFTQEDIERAPKQIERYYAPSYVPPQFELVSEEYRPADEQRIYLDGAGNVLVFTQSVLWQFEADTVEPARVVSRFGVTAEDVTIETVILQGYEIKVIHIKAPSSTEDIEIIWTDHEYIYAIGIPSIDITEIGRIVGSLSLVDPKR